METLSRKEWNKLMALALDGDMDAQWNLGYYYEYGAVDKSQKILANIDIPQALKWLTLSAKQGYVYAQQHLANILSSEESFIDYQAAIHWAKKAIAQGDASSAYNLGTIYRDLNRPARAFYWYMRASSMGDKDAFLQIGLCYLFGFGVKQDFDKAYGSFGKVINNYDEVTQRSYENTQYWMGVLLLLRSGSTKKAVSNARKMLEIANADDDHEQANDILNLIGKTIQL